MGISRREFVVGAAACACGFGAGCAATNPARLVRADMDGTLIVPPELGGTGGQVKVAVPGVEGPVLVWRARDGLHAVSIRCAHRGSEVHWNPAEETLDCPSHGSRYRADGSVLHGPAETGLKVFRVETAGERLRIQA
jgi:Rieske Fe-S protein